MFTSISHEKNQVSSLFLIWSLEAQAPSLFLLHYSEHGPSVFKVNHGCHHIHNPGSLDHVICGHFIQVYVICGDFIKEAIQDI